ncbi:MAG: dual specificity protein phosphatase family protein [Anaerolineae bacterium]|nr:dual specificity protein phosphatase family protein [Anaerolineae bacterium]
MNLAIPNPHPLISNQSFTHSLIHSFFSFAPAAEYETHVFGSCRPGYPNKVVDDAAVRAWLEFMDRQRIRRVCCLLGDEQLAYYDTCAAPLLATYRAHFGTANVLHAPIADFTLAPLPLLRQHILPFLADAYANNAFTVVHCAAGIGRTGHVLAAWLVRHYGLSNPIATAAVAKLGRNAHEAGGDLDALLNAVRVS